MPNPTPAASAILFFFLLMTAPGAAQQSILPPQQHLELGQPLAKALQALNDRGYKIISTSALVRPSMRVNSIPPETELQDFLHQLLVPHGLTADSGPDGTWVVVRLNRPHREPLPGSITGTILSRETGAPVRGVVVTVEGRSEHLTSDQSGSFTFSDLASGNYRLRFRRRGFVVTESNGVLVTTGEVRSILVLLDPAPISGDNLVVTPSHVALLQEDPERPLALNQDDIHSLPHLGDDLFRTLSLLPGVSANDVTAQFRVRGSRRNETLILLDGQELYAPYHLHDFDSAVSIIDAETVESIDLFTGGFSAEHGDRMSGVLDITTKNPSGPTQTFLGLSVLNTQLGSSGLLSNGRGGWVAQGRRGSIDLVDKLLGNRHPSYWDIFAKFDFSFNNGTAMRVNALITDDNLKIQEVLEDSDKDVRTDYRTSYLWLTQQTILTSDLFFESALSTSRVGRDRRAFELEEDVEFQVRDVRELGIWSARQNWTLQATPRQSLSLGFETRHFDTEYDYQSQYLFDNPLAVVRNDEDDSNEFVDDFGDRHNSLFVTDQIHASKSTTLDLGLRFDRHSQTHESLLSPRASLAYAVGQSGVMRASWGRFNQSQRPYELLVEDGDNRFYPVERSDHRLLGYEHLFHPQASKGISALRLEVYQRSVANPIPRYENLFEVLNVFPELEPDRVRVDPETSTAEGFELLLRGSLGIDTSLWGSYANSTTKDRIDGRDVVRRFDQTHAVTLDLNHRINDYWQINLAWSYHTGWPTTPLELEKLTNEEGEIVFSPVLGSRNSERVPDYHRLDLRASRQWTKGPASILFFVDVQNLYNQDNLAGFDVVIDEELGTLEVEPEGWAGILPSAGLKIQF